MKVSQIHRVAPDFRFAESEMFAAHDAALPDLAAADLAPVSAQLLMGYSSLVSKGHPEGAVAVAMLRAAINFCCLFGAANQAPDLLRRAADLIEYGPARA